MKDEMAAYVKRMDVRHPFFLLPVVPSLQRTQRRDCVSFGTLRSGMSSLTFSRIVPTAVFIIHSGSNLPWHSWVLNVLDSYPYKLAAVIFFSLSFTYVQLQHYTRYVHGQRVICSTPEILVTRFCNLKANASALTQNY